MVPPVGTEQPSLDLGTCIALCMLAGILVTFCFPPCNPLCLSLSKCVLLSMRMIVPACLPIRCIATCGSLQLIP